MGVVFVRGFYYDRRRMSRRTALRLLWLSVLIGLVILTAVATGEMRSMLTRLAVARVSNAVNRIVNESVNDAVDGGTFQYDRLISFEKDNDGKITAVKSNMPEFNRLQSAILD